jgi:thymidylate kinase
MRCDRDHSAATARHQGEVARARALPARADSAPDRGPILVEFLGIAGSGKTTLCSAIVSELRRNGFTIVTRDDYFAWMRQPWHKKAGAVVTNGLQTWRFVFRVYRFLYYSARLRGHTLIKAGYHLTYMQVWLSRTVSRTPHLPILLDQFAWHRLANQLMHRPLLHVTGSQLADTVDLFYPRCDLHWVLKIAPAELAVQRIRERHARENRAPWFIEKLSPDRQKILLHQQMRLYQLVCDALQARYGDNVHRVDGAKPIPKQLHHIRSILMMLLKKDTSNTANFDASPMLAER